MSTTRKKTGENSRISGNWYFQFKQIKENLRNKQIWHSWIKNTSWLLMLLLATTMWQCNKDDYKGETIGVCPKVISTDPVDGAINVATDKIIKATFNEKMDPVTINETTFLLKQGSNLIAGTVSFSDSTATFTPAVPLSANTVYTGIITTGARDLSGNALVKDTTWNFTTPTAQFAITLASSPFTGGVVSSSGTFNNGATVAVLAVPNNGFTFKNWTEGSNIVSTDANYTFTISGNRTLTANFTSTTLLTGPNGVDLISSGNFAILSGSGVTNIGVTTMITGDVGAFPTATINGLLSVNVNGILYTTADPKVGTAKTDLTTAYNDAQGRSTNAISLPGQLGGLTLAPGLYVNSTSSGISGTGTNGILTLDAQGNANAVWIFKMGSTLVTSAGTSIVLAGGAQAKNIYWSVGTSATLGTNAVFYGNILADQSITLTTGAKLYGRAMARIGSVTLDSNTVTKP